MYLVLYSPGFVVSGFPVGLERSAFLISVPSSRFASAHAPAPRPGSLLWERQRVDWRSLSEHTGLPVQTCVRLPFHSH